jgi:hypothetical protein
MQSLTHNAVQMLLILQVADGDVVSFKNWWSSCERDMKTTPIAKKKSLPWFSKKKSVKVLSGKRWNNIQRRETSRQFGKCILDIRRDLNGGGRL